MKSLVFAGLAVLFLGSCKGKVEDVERAVYYWKNSSWIDSEEDTIAKQLGIKKLYVKFFEVSRDADQGNIPIAKTELNMHYTGDGNILETATAIPTVYIDNAVFLKSSKSEIDTLVSNMDFLIKKYEKEKFTKANHITEWQVDCDWTLKTKNNYFYFLKEIKKVSQRKISCTLRLYPYKYSEKMGVPPVDSAVLMCYNLINPQENKSRNSILDLDELAAYLDRSGKYPLHLDIALPIYSWMHVYQNNYFAGVIYPENKTIGQILKPVRPLWYEVTKDTFIDGFYLRAGDNVKYEKLDSAQIFNAIKLLKKKVEFDARTTIILFHLDKNQFNNFNHETLSRFYSDFRQ